MKVTIEIPKEFERDYDTDRFKDFFSRVMCDIKDGTLCGKYEQETAEMLMNAFRESEVARCTAADYLEKMCSRTASDNLSNTQDELSSEDERRAQRVKEECRGIKDLVLLMAETLGMFRKADGTGFAVYPDQWHAVMVNRICTDDFTGRRWRVQSGVNSVQITEWVKDLEFRVLVELQKNGIFSLVYNVVEPRQEIAGCDCLIYAKDDGVKLVPLWDVYKAELLANQALRSVVTSV